MSKDLVGTYHKILRDCKAIKIPDGIPLIVPKGQEVCITQLLGGMFTVETEDFFLARIDGKDADALGLEVPKDAIIDFSTIKNLPLRDQIFEVLKTCYDPEISANIVDLGLIYEVDVIKLSSEEYQIDVQMTLTAPGCGMGGILTEDVIAKIKELPNIKTVNVSLVFDPPWDQSMMSDAAKLHLGML
jgi:probable FeS assembly SUF system protein SufT